MAQPSRTFRIFVRSTFSDLKAERNALQQRVFPKLRRLCLEHGARFQTIDLRWGVSEEAAVDQQTMNICLEELRRCRRIAHGSRTWLRMISVSATGKPPPPAEQSKLPRAGKGKQQW